jgi:hypothetical protein
MVNTNCVTSCVWMGFNVTSHQRTFGSFPSTRYPCILSLCFPSILFHQLRSVKSMMHHALNTRSLNSRNTAVFHIAHIDIFTWSYIKKILLWIELHPTPNNMLIEGTECILVRSRIHVQKICLSEATHLHFVQDLFGLTVAVGVQFVLPWRLTRCSSNAINRREIWRNNMLNVVPFEDENAIVEMICQSIEMKYKLGQNELTMTVHYRRLIGEDNCMPHLEARRIIQPPPIIIDDNLWPLHNDTMIASSLADSINLRNHIIRLKDNQIFSIEWAIKILASSL